MVDNGESGKEKRTGSYSRLVSERFSSNLGRSVLAFFSVVLSFSAACSATICEFDGVTKSVVSSYFKTNSFCVIDSRLSSWKVVVDD